MSDENFAETIAIVGVGLMGGSIGLALKAVAASSGRPAPRMLAVGRNVEKLELAKQLGAADAYETDLARGVAQADLIVLCTPIGNIIDIMPQVLKTAAPSATITDIGSTKSAIVDAAGDDPRFIGGHPMTGSEKTGVEAATVTLYHRSTWAVTPTKDTSDRARSVLSDLIATVGANELVLDPVVHDTMVALTSHVPHVMASALMRQAADLRTTIPALPRMCAGSFADMTRIAASSPAIWRDVCLTNRQAVLQTLKGYRAELDVLEQAVEESDADAIEAFFAAGEFRQKDLATTTRMIS